MSDTSPRGLWSLPKGEFEQSIQDFEKALVKKGIDPRKVFDYFRKNPEFTDMLVRFILFYITEPPKPKDGIWTYQEARKIMGYRNFWGPEDWTAFHGVEFTREEIWQILLFPWGEKLLNSPCPFTQGKTIKETHFAFLGLEQIDDRPLTIVALEDMYPATEQPRFDCITCGYDIGDHAHLRKYPIFGHHTCRFQWYLMPKFLPPTQYTEHSRLIIPAKYKLTSAVEEVSRCLFTFNKTGDYPDLQGGTLVSDNEPGGAWTSVCRTKKGLSFGGGGMLMIPMDYENVRIGLTRLYP